MFEYSKKNFSFQRHLQELIDKKLGGKRIVLARKANISAAYLTGILGGRQNQPTLPILVAMAEALGVSLNYLMTGEEYHPESLLSEIKGLLNAAKTQEIEIPNEETKELVMLLGRNKSTNGFTSTLVRLLKKPDEETKELKDALKNLIEISLGD